MSNILETYVDYIENHLPGLKSGDYSIKIEQNFDATGVKATTYTNRPMDFTIQGERFNLNPKEIIGVYPPANSLGEHSNVFPQIVFERNTLPWERMIAAPKNTDDEERKKVEKMPWMALLVFNEDELISPNSDATDVDKQQGVVINLKDFRTAMNDTYPKEFGEKDNDKLTVIYPKKEILEKLLPTGEDLCKICHARESNLNLILEEAPMGENLYYEIRNSKKSLIHAAHLTVKKGEKNQKINLNLGVLKEGIYSVTATIDDQAIQLKSANTNLQPTNQKIQPAQFKVTPNDEFGHKVAIVSSNRLPKQGARSIVHLVSLENRYKWDEAKKAYVFDFSLSKDPDLIPFVSLKAWTFDCVTETHNFDRMLVSLSSKTAAAPENILCLPLRPNPNHDPNIENANKYLASGYVPMTHFFRRGGKSVSWYRSPLLPGQKTNDSFVKEKLPASCSDSLLMYEENSGMFNTSYAAAWELGRLMALRNKGMSTSLYRWKKLHQNQMALAEQQEKYSHLPFHKGELGAIKLPELVEKWFSDLSLLKGLPFNYLVPDEAMLPKESIRFFELDQNWLDCLIDGAFNVGRLTELDRTNDKKLYEKFIANQSKPKITGFLMRSFVVKGWPKLQVDGHSQYHLREEDMDTSLLPLLRMERLSSNVLICLFEGEVKAVDIHQKPEMLHLGFDISLEENVYKKKLRQADGQESSKFVQLTDSNWDKTTRIVHVEQLFLAIGQQQELGFAGTFTSAQYALSMVEGVQQVRLLSGV